MDPDTFSHIRLWCPRPFGTYSQNKPCGGAGGGGAGGGALRKAAGELVGRTPTEVDEGESASENTPPPPPAPKAPPPPPPSGAQVEEGRVLLDTWYVIKPGNTKEKIAFFVAHQCSGVGLARPSAMKVKGNWGTDCSKAKRRRRCSSYDPPGKVRGGSSELTAKEPSSEQEAPELNEMDLLSVAEMVALVEQRTAMALQGMVTQGPLQSHPMPTSPSPMRGSPSSSGSIVFLSESPEARPQSSTSGSPAPEKQQPTPDSRRVARAIAHFESQQQQLESALLRRAGAERESGEEDQQGEAGGSSGNRGRGGGGGEVRIAFRVSSMDPRSQSEPAGRPNCMFLSCGGGGGSGSPAGARAKEKITCDLYQLVSPSSRDPLPTSNMGLLLAASPKADSRGEGQAERPIPPTGSDSAPDGGNADKKARECVTGFHVEVVVTGAVDQCVFYGKDSTENVQEETVCFTVGSQAPDPGEDPPPGQLFFLQPPRPEEEGVAHGSLDCANNNGPAGSLDRPDSPTAASEPDSADTSLCRLYRHVSHDFLEIRFKIQRLLEPRQYMLLLPDHIMVNIFSYLPTRSLAALKCTCHDFKALIETYGIHATDSRWNQDPLYRDDPCKQCKRHYERGDVSLCRWHPKPYHHDLPYGRSYWMCCRRTDKDTPGCRVGLHDNNWVQPCELVHARSRREDGR
uniref:F-box protein 46 n=1 Tax=Lepisosteus oculatus TaxID=7918 RepID=W5NM11_LEPOC